jgi:hypothetical protein
MTFKQKTKKAKEIPADSFKEESQIKSDLAGFTGTMNYYRSTFGALKLTDGMHFLRERAKSYWLIDIVESVQYMPQIKKNNEFIVWRIDVQDDKTFKVTAWTDTPYHADSELLYQQEGKYTDFPMKSFEFYQEGDVLLLRSEH